MSMMLETNQSEIVCRACLSDNSESYLNICEVSSHDKTYKELIESLSSFVVQNNEPLFVCEACAIQLEESYKFKQTLEETQLILSQMKIVEKDEVGGEKLVEDERIVYEEIEILNEVLKQEMSQEDDLIEEIEDESLEELLINRNPEMRVYDLTNCVVEVVGKDFACMFCSKQFTKERGLIDHLNRYHRDKKNVECKLCHRCFYSTDYRDAHTPRCPALIRPKSDNIIVCPECGRTGERKLIRNHILNVHRKKREGPFQCDLCKIWLKSKECVSNHMKAKHLHRKFQCKYCEKCYSSRSGHDQHIQQYHTRETTYNCNLCPYKTHSKTLLRKHQLRHTSTASFHCVVCNTSFVSLDNLRRHQYVHTDARPWICETCNRGFKSKEALKKHQLIHQEYRYECPKCDRKYLTNQAMRNHCTRQHPDYKLPPLGTILAADAKLKKTTEINTKLQKAILFPPIDVMGLIHYDGEGLN